ncbi:unnamed protein product [Schistosoma rodhaini]|nr:unnamed protein product [Schistosoma rodhaini]
MLHTTTTINNTNRSDNSFNHSSPGSNSSPLAQSCTRPLSVFTDFSSSNNNNTNTIATTTTNNNINESGITRRKSDTVDATAISTTDNMTINSSTSLSPHNYYTCSEINANMSITSDSLMSFPTQSKLTETRAETPSTIPASDPSLCDTTSIVITSADKNKSDNTSAKSNRNIDTINTTTTTNDNSQTLSSMNNPSSFTSNKMLNNLDKTHPPETWIISHSPASSSFSCSQPPSPPPPPLAMTMTTTVMLSQLGSNSLLSSSSSIQSSVKSPLMISSTTTSTLSPITTSLSFSSSPSSSQLATTSFIPSSQQYTTSSSLTTTTTTNTTVPTIIPERRCTGVNTLLDNSKATLTEPDLLGPCEPGTTICLNGIVWLETTTGVLVVNVTWRGRTYIGTLLDATQHDFAPPCPRDYVPPFKSSIRSSNRTKRRTGVGTNYKPNLTNHLTTNDCNWKSTTNGRHRLRGRASNSPAVNNNNGNGIETISTTNRCNTHHLTKIDTEKELINDNVIQEDTDIIQCLPHVSDEEHLTRSSSNNRKSKLHNKSRKLFRGSSTSSSDCPSEILPDLEKLSEIGDFPGKTDGILCDPPNPDHSRPQTPSCMSNNTINPDKNSNDHVCFEENDELHETFPIGCPIDGCKKRFSHVLALRFHLNHTSHCNLLDSHKKRPSSIDLKKQDIMDTTSIMTMTTTTDTNDNKNNNSAENGSSTYLKCPPTISPCQPSSSSPLSIGITTSGLLNSFSGPLLPSSSSSLQQQQLKQESNLYDPQSCPVLQSTSEYHRDTMSIPLQQMNMSTHHHNYKLYHKNEQKLFDMNLSNDYVNVIKNSNTTNDNNNSDSSMNSVMHSVSKQRNNEMNKHSGSKKRSSTSMSSNNNNNPIIDITSLNNVRTVTAHTVSVPHGSLDIVGNLNSRSNQQHQHHHHGQQQNHQTNNGNSFPYSKRTTPTSSTTPRDFSSKHKGGQQQLSNKLSYPNMKIDNNHNNSTVMNYSRYSSGSTQHYGSLDQQSIKSELSNDYMINLTMCHTTTATNMSTMSKLKNLTVNQQELNTSLSNNNMIPSFLLQNAWNLQLPTSSTYTQSMPLSFNNSNKEDESKSTINSLTNGLPSSLYLSTYSNMPTLTSSGSVVNNSPINTMPCSSTPSLSMYEMSTASQPFNDSKQYIPSNHHHPFGTSNQSADLNTTTTNNNNTSSMYYGIPDFLVAALSTLASNASSYSCIPEPFKSYFNQNSLMNNTTNPINTTHLNSNGNSISKVTNLSSSNMSPSNSGILDGTINNRFFNPQFFQNYGTNLSNVQNFQSFNHNNGGGAGNVTLNPERLDPLKLSAAYLMQYTNPDTTQLLSSSVSSSSVTSTYGNSILP